ncbi:MAG TPA: ATP synthase F1 subunit epsilon [Cytophagales bacterium]|nr:ATP synthase F1 subunit epsilon [Cytophagales bacterium]HAA19842.1 ATP synthase F1 subunit epsilon [Cytophagales bacterium]HAP63765.1 ATP synthase F1 subunit epsilon [Cytophagales bacterium]
MYLEIITPEQKVFEGEVDSATFPGSNGTFQVLNDHAPLVSSLAKGEVKYSAKTGEHTIIIDGGVVEVLNNTISLLAEAVSEEA